ncbi:MAG: MmgE/PrpD family protein [Chloroflexi bacterium]|nr:MmgE/PrpD family protein [Chloroflexota bacterium]MDA1219342.1 MmgE/PrpD family protein [Chloroflexota bacterium]
MGTTGDLARYVVATSADQIPEAIIHEGKRCLINFLSVALYSSRDPSLDILLDIFRQEGGGRRASVLGSGVRTSLQNAALANGYLGHLEDYDDTHFPTVIHPSSPTLPAALALGEQLSSSGLDVLAASVLGMEACCRIGMAVHPYHYDEGWHITGTCGVFGSVIAAGRLVGLDTRQMTEGLGIAGTQAAGVREVFGSMTKPFHPGRSAQSGVLAALLAQRGFTSTTTILEGRRGFAAVMSEDSHLERVTEGLGEHWELTMNGLKPYACGVVNHPLIDAMIALRNKPGVTAESVESVRAKVHPLVLELVDRPNPQVGLEGKFSYQHSMAVGLVDGGAFPAQYTDERVKNHIIAGLRERIEATIDDSLVEDAAEVTVTLRDGRAYTEKVEHATGAPENPMTDRQLDDKFRALVGNVLSKARVERLLASLWDLDSVEDIGDVVRQMRVTRRQVRE